MERVSNSLLLLALVALPLHRPLLHQRPNIGPCDLLAGLAIVAWLLTRGLPRSTGWRLGLILAAVAPSLWVAPDRGRAAAMMLGLIYIQLLHQIASSLGERARRDGLLAILAGAAIACALGFVIWQAYPWMPTPRPTGATESPAMLSMIALAGLFALHRLRPQRRFGWPLAALFWITLVAAQSRILLAATIGIGVMICLRPGTSRRRLRLAQAAICVSLVVLVGSLVVRYVPLSASPPFIDLHPSPYLVCHEIAWRAFAAHPFAGVGLRGFHAAWPHFLDDRARAVFAPLSPTPLDPHSTLAGWSAEAGLPGLVLVVVLAADLWRRRLRAPEIAGYLAAILAASFTLDVLTERTTWALLGLLSSVVADATAEARCGRAERRGKPPESTAPSPSRRGASPGPTPGT